LVLSKNGPARANPDKRIIFRPLDFSRARIEKIVRSAPRGHAQTGDPEC
jgi:hypothetical protein